MYTKNAICLIIHYYRWHNYETNCTCHNFLYRQLLYLHLKESSSLTRPFAAYYVFTRLDQLLPCVNFKHILLVRAHVFWDPSKQKKVSCKTCMLHVTKCSIFIVIVNIRKSRRRTFWRHFNVIFCGLLPNNKRS